MAARKAAKRVAKVATPKQKAAQRKWATGALKPRGYLRPSGRRGNHRRSDEDEPLYSWPDVEELRANPVGAARRKARARR